MSDINELAVHYFLGFEHPPKEILIDEYPPFFACSALVWAKNTNIMGFDPQVPFEKSSNYLFPSRGEVVGRTPRENMSFRPSKTDSLH